MYVRMTITLACEKADRKLAVSLQFIIGDKVHVTYEGSQYTGDILSGINNNMVEVRAVDTFWEI